jgi:hypothetical protein
MRGLPAIRRIGTTTCWTNLSMRGRSARILRGRKFRIEAGTFGELEGTGDIE